MSRLLLFVSNRKTCSIATGIADAIHEHYKLNPSKIRYLLPLHNHPPKATRLSAKPHSKAIKITMRAAVEQPLQYMRPLITENLSVADT